MGQSPEDTTRRISSTANLVIKEDLTKEFVIAHGRLPTERESTLLTADYIQKHWGDAAESK